MKLKELKGFMIPSLIILFVSMVFISVNFFSNLGYFAIGNLCGILEIAIPVLWALRIHKRKVKT